MGAMVAGGGGALAWGSPEKKLGRGGQEGWPGRRRTDDGECFRGGWGGAPPAVGGGGGGLSGGVSRLMLLHDQLPRLSHVLLLLFFCY